MSTPRQYPIRSALVAPDLVWGAERYLVWPLGAIVGVIVYACLFTAPKWALIGLLVGALSLWGLQFLAKRDPQWFRVYLRSRKYKAYYPANSRARRRK